MESEVEKARMLLDDGEPEESMEAAGDKEKTDNAEDTDKEETVTEIFDLDDTKPDEDNLDDDEDVVTVEKRMSRKTDFWMKMMWRFLKQMIQML